MAETRQAAKAALDTFIASYGIKYDKAVECLTKDREALISSASSSFSTLAKKSRIGGRRNAASPN